MKKCKLIVLTVAMLCIGLLSCKKDNDRESALGLLPDKVKVAEGETAFVKVSSQTNLKQPISSKKEIATADFTGVATQLKITGKKVGTANVDVYDLLGNKATIEVTVTPKTKEEKNGFEVEAKMLFLKEREEKEITDRVLKGSGNYKIESLSSAATTVRQDGGKLFVTGIAKGVSGKIRISDEKLYKDGFEIPVYVTIPFEPLNAPSTIEVGVEYQISFNGIYEKIGDIETNGYAQVNYIRTPKKNQTGQVIPDQYDYTGITVKGLSVGNAIITIKNGDEQTCELRLKVVQPSGDKYFDIKDGVLLKIKAGVTLPTDVTIPAEVTKVAEFAFQGHPEVKTINFNNVTEIVGSLFNNKANPIGIQLTSVTMPKVQKVGYDTFRNAKQLKVIDFPATLTHLGNESLHGCTILQKVVFRGATPPKGLTSLPQTIIPGVKREVQELANAAGAFDSSNANNRYLYVQESSIGEYSRQLQAASNFRGGGTADKSVLPLTRL